VGIASDNTGPAGDPTLTPRILGERPPGQSRIAFRIGNGGMKYSDGFHHTHLGMLGPPDEPRCRN
jgi:hypothetical protein